MAVDDKGYTQYKPGFDNNAAAARRLETIRQNEAESDNFSKFRSQLEANQRAFDESMRMRRASIQSMGAASRNAQSLMDYGADLMGRVNATMNPWSDYGSAGPSNGGGVVSAPGGEFGAFARAISHHESGGNYNAVNRHSGALGKYQIMPFNISSWSRAALGYTISPSQFLSSPQYQEKIAQHQLRQYYNQYGPAGAAVAWYAGPGAAQRFVRQGYASRGTEANGYPSVYSYLNNIMRTMRSYL